MNIQRPWHEYEHNFQIMYKVGMGHKPPIPEKLSTEGKDFLGHCLESEPKRRWTASMLLDHPFVKVTQIKTHYSTPTPPPQHFSVPKQLHPLFQVCTDEE